MRVKVKLYALLRQNHPGPNRSEPIPVDLPAGARVRDLIGALNLPEKYVRSAFVNDEARDLDWPLADDDRVGLFPPVAGGQ